MIVCADDYGLSDDIDLAILELSSCGKLSAVSCMAVLQRCTSKALSTLLQYQSHVDVGLHLCLTDERLPLSAAAQDGVLSRWRPVSFGTLFRRCITGRVDRREIASLISAQYELFLAKAGKRPDFIDGHLHVHQFPGVREGLLDFVASLPAGSRPYIRNTYLPLRKIRKGRLPQLKAAFIGALGARMRQQLCAAGVPTNDGFAGIYDFRKWPKYGTYLPRFVASLCEPNGMLVVHPGGSEAWRRQEFKLLAEFSFPSGSPNRFRPEAAKPGRSLTGAIH
jgi:hypothetical protein